VIFFIKHKKKRENCLTGLQKNPLALPIISLFQTLSA